MDKAELQEIMCLRAVLERILRVMDEGLFVDYQMEKFGRIAYDPSIMPGVKNKTHVERDPRTGKVLITRGPRNI